MSMSDVAQWIFDTPLSATLQETTWAVPTIQSVHIAAITVLVGSALMINLRVAGVVARDAPPADVGRRYLPWLSCAVAALAASGVLLIFAEPLRELGNAIFWWKMLLAAAGVLVTLAVRGLALGAGGAAASGLALKVLAGAGLLVWLAVIFCGRWIAYSVY